MAKEIMALAGTEFPLNAIKTFLDEIFQKGFGKWFRGNSSICYVIMANQR